MKATGLRGMAVVAIDTAEKVGVVEDLIIAPDVQRIAALRLRPASPGAPRTIPVERIHGLGRDAITVEWGSREREGSGPALEESESDRIDSLEELLGARVLSYSGNHLGTVADVEFDPRSFQITGYELSTGPLSGLVGGRRRVPAREGINYGKGILTVPEVERAGEEETPADKGEKPARSRRR